MFLLLVAFAFNITGTFHWWILFISFSLIKRYSFVIVQFIYASRPSTNTLSGIQGKEATAVAVIYVTAPTSSRKTTKYK